MKTKPDACQRAGSNLENETMSRLFSAAGAATTVAMSLCLCVLCGCGESPQPKPATAAKAAPKQIEPPKAPDGAVFRPVFQTSAGEVDAGTAFVVSCQGRPTLVSALHLLGPAGGLAASVPAAKVGSVVTQVDLSPCFAGEPPAKLSFAAHAINIPNAKPLGQGQISTGAGDVIAFWMPADTKCTPLALGDHTPHTGERVWLAASVSAGATANARLHPAEIIEIDQAGDLLYAFDSADLELRATSGAPVLNAQGHVVAIHLGGGNPQGKLLGVGNPVSRFRTYLERAKPPQ